MTTRIHTTAKALLIAGLLAAAGSANAWGLDICSKVKLDIKNNAGETIQIYDIDYYDYGSSVWRSEPTVNRVLNNGGSWQDTRNLEDVENASTKLRVKYRKLNSKNRWDGRYTATSSKVTCTKGKRISVTIN